LLAGVLVVGYFVFPVLLAPGAEAADVHSVRTLRNRDDRTGRPVTFDRTAFVRIGGEPHLRTFGREQIALVGELPTRPGTVSVRGVFIHPDTLRVEEVHEHGRWPREELSMIGIALILIVWIRALLPPRTSVSAAKD
jgi:hypothetical protein